MEANCRRGTWWIQIVHPRPDEKHVVWGIRLFHCLTLWPRYSGYDTGFASPSAVKVPCLWKKSNFSSTAWLTEIMCPKVFSKRSEHFLYIMMCFNFMILVEVQPQQDYPTFRCGFAFWPSAWCHQSVHGVEWWKTHFKTVQTRILQAPAQTATSHRMQRRTPGTGFWFRFWWTNQYHQISMISNLDFRTCFELFELTVNSMNFYVLLNRAFDVLFIFWILLFLLMVFVCMWCMWRLTVHWAWSRRCWCCGCLCSCSCCQASLGSLASLVRMSGWNAPFVHTFDRQLKPNLLCLIEYVAGFTETVGWDSKKLRKL